ncbi:class II aldolase/adducin family protein [Falsiroseomonas sp. E2-1-a4]|uniref:class II aldolase/adducin family protein n=1 Tax=Falsiroseomonas sp. E2-1-a4 TaxID=3239299 RepID=UPI003F2E43C0
MNKEFRVARQPEATPAQEGDVRTDLAAAYRLCAHYGLDDLIYSHVTARAPGTTDQFLIAPHGLWFHEVTASSLARVDFDGNVVEHGSHPELPISRFAVLLHSALYRARPEVQSSIHMHTRAGLAVSMLEEGFLTANHTGMRFHGDVAYHDYEGDFRDRDEGERLTAALGPKNVLVLRNHGLVTLGETVGAAFSRMYYLEFLCRVQIDVRSMGQVLRPPTAQVTDLMTTTWKNHAYPLSAHEWPAFLRLADHLDPGFRS